MVSIHQDEQKLTWDSPVKLRSKGPQFLRECMVKRVPGLVKREHRKSAVELLEATKPLYVKSESVLDQRQLLKHPEKCLVGPRPPNLKEKPVNTRLQEVTGERSRSASRDEVPQIWQKQDKNNNIQWQAPSQLNLFRGNVRTKVITYECNGNHKVTNHKVINKMSSGSDSDEATGFEASGYATILKRPKHSASGSNESENKSKKAGSEGTGSSSDAAPSTPLLHVDEWRDPKPKIESDKEEEEELDDVIVIRRRQKEVSRSQSDLSHRLSNSSDWSELSARLSRNSADLEKFFNEMGLDKKVLDTMLNTQCSSRSVSEMHLYESLSSLDSQEGRSAHSGDSKISDTGIRTVTIPGELPGQTSIVERNARIIKWLYSIKKQGASANNQNQNNPEPST